MSQELLKYRESMAGSAWTDARCSMCHAHILFFRGLAENLRLKAEILCKQGDEYMQYSCLDLARIIDEHIQRTSNGGGLR